MDPFFDKVGAEALLPRIRNDVNLTIVTSLPRDDQRLYEELTDYLNAIGPLMIPHGVRILRATSAGGTQQAFHDRFLLLDKPGERPVGYSLTNSLSGAARQYPLVMAELQVAAAGAVSDYIQSVLAGDGGVVVSDLWRAKAPTPPCPAERANFLYFGPYWRLYLNRVVRRAASSDQEWLSAAAALGFLVLRDGETKWIATAKARSQVVAKMFPRRPHVPDRLRRCHRDQRGQRFSGQAASRLDQDRTKART